jgi:hypothetical protein
VGRKPFAVLFVFCAVLTVGCGLGGEMSADELEEFLTLASADEGWSVPARHLSRGRREA